MDCGCARLAHVCEDGNAVFNAVSNFGFEGRCEAPEREGYRGWTKIKNPSYWRRKNEIAHMQRSRTRAGRIWTA